MKLSPAAAARQAIDAVILPQGWEHFEAWGEWYRCAAFNKGSVNATLDMRVSKPAGSVIVEGGTSKAFGSARIVWVGNHLELQAGIAWVTTALLVRA